MNKTTLARPPLQNLKSGFFLHKHLFTFSAHQDTSILDFPVSAAAMISTSNLAGSQSEPLRQLPGS
jgi:hypothetical protein